MDKFINEFTKEIKEIFEQANDDEKLIKKLDICTRCDIYKFYDANFLNWFRNERNKKWIIWIDILGFKNIISNWSEKKILSLLSFIKNYLYSNFLLEEVHIFSDTVIATAPLGKQDLIDILEYLAILQLQIVEVFNIFIRGSISIGKIFTFSEFHGTPSKLNMSLFLFGEGLIKAYLLEQKAKYPIIILDEFLVEIINLIFSLAEDIKWRYRYPEDYKNGELKLLFPQGDSNFDFLKNRLLKRMISSIKIGNISYYFIDYLKQLYNIEDEDNITKFLELHRNLLIRRYYTTKHNPSINEKYKWLIQYHNSRVPRRFQVRIFKPERKNLHREY